MADNPNTPNVNDIASTLKTVLTSTLKIAAGSTFLDIVTKSIAKHYGEMAQQQQMTGIGFDKMALGSGKRSKELSEIQKLLTTALINQNNVMKRREKTLETTFDIQTKINEAAATPATNQPQVLDPLRRQMDLAIEAISEMNQETDELSREIERLKSVAGPASSEMAKLTKAATMFAAVSYASGLAHVVKFSHELNETIIEANSGLQERYGLLKSALDVQMQTGVSTRTVLDVQREMVSIGADVYNAQVAQSQVMGKNTVTAMSTKKTFDETLRTAVMLVEGLGASAKEAVQLQITARAAGVEYRAIADTISKIVDSTGVAADEAIRYARSLTSAAKMAQGNQFKFNTDVFNRNLTTLAGIEGSIKNNIGVQGEISDMLAKFADYNKLGGVGTYFGTGGIEFQSEMGKVGDVLEKFAKQTAGMRGPLLSSFAKMTELSETTLLGIQDAYQEARRAGLSLNEFYAKQAKDRADDSKLQERYNRQLSVTGEIFSRLGKQLVILASTALSPLLQIINAISLGLSKLIGMASESGPMAGVIHGFKILFQIFVTGYLVSKIVAITSVMGKWILSIIAAQLAIQASTKANITAATINAMANRAPLAPVPALGRPRIRSTPSTLTGAPAPTAPKVSAISVPVPKAGPSTLAQTGRDIAAMGAVQKMWTSITTGFTKLRDLFIKRPPTIVGEAMAKQAVGTAAAGRVGGAAAEVGLSVFFVNLWKKLSSFFGRLFSSAAAEKVGETSINVASKGLLARMFGGISTWVTGTLMRSVVGRIIAGVVGLAGGWIGLIAGLVITLITMYWPKISSLFEGKKKSQQSVAGVDEFQERAAKMFAMELAKGNQNNLASTLQEYADLIQVKELNLQQVDTANAFILRSIDDKIGVMSGAAQRAQGIDPKQDKETAELLKRQVELMEQMREGLKMIHVETRRADLEQGKRDRELEERQRRERLRMLPSHGGFLDLPGTFNPARPFR